MLKISILHATYMSGTNPTRHRDFWLSAARYPQRVEYICAMNADDSVAVEATATGVLRVVNEAPDGYSTAVQNWNSAAARATGDLLVVVSDDLFPPPDWDIRLEELVTPLRPQETDFALKIQDSPFPADTTLRHPVISRGFFDKFGLFDSAFRGVYCDNDITLRAFLFSVIVDGRSIQFAHEHPHFDHSVNETVSQRKINAAPEYEFGREVFVRKWFPVSWKLNLNRLSLPHRVKSRMPNSVLRRLVYHVFLGRRRIREFPKVRTDGKRDPQTRVGEFNPSVQHLE